MISLPSVIQPEIGCSASFNFNLSSLRALRAVQNDGVGCEAKGWN